MTKRKDPMVTVTLPVSKLVICTENHGGYEAGRCIACDASGWFPLKHKPTCPVLAAGVPVGSTSEPRLCAYCGIVIDSGMVCTTEGEFSQCPARILLDDSAGVEGPEHAPSLAGLADWLRTQAKHPCAGEANGQQWTAWAAAVDAASGVNACAHRLVDARNKIVESGYVCVDCGAMFAAADHGVPGTPADQPKGGA